MYTWKVIIPFGKLIAMIFLSYIKAIHEGEGVFKFLDGFIVVMAANIEGELWNFVHFQVFRDLFGTLIRGWFWLF